MNRAEARSQAERLRRDALRQQLLLDLDRRAIDWGTAAHETIHQLVVASGLSPRHGQFPLWLHEGFAAQFEVVRGGAGPGSAGPTTSACPIGAASIRPPGSPP